MGRAPRNPLLPPKGLEALPASPSAAISPGGLLHSEFRGASWDRWRAILKAAWGEPLTDGELEMFREVAGGRSPPPGRVKELWLIVGRRGGKDSIASAVAAVVAMQDYSEFLRAGEFATIACLASDRDQASIVKNYTLGYFNEFPRLKGFIKNEADDVIEMSNRCEIRITTNNKKSVRGRNVVCAILDEVAYWSVNRDAANSDMDVFDALEPSTSSIPGSIIIGISTPNHKRGLLYDRWVKHYGKDSPDVLVIQAPSRMFNKTLKQSIVDRRMEVDEISARAEYLAEWRPGISDFLPRELVTAAVDEGVAARAPETGVAYSGFVDGAAGTGESSFTAAIAHGEDGKLMLDALLEIRPPFNPVDAVDEVSRFFRSYGIGVATGDNHARPWLVDGFGKAGIRYEKSATDKSTIFSNALPRFTAGLVRLIDNPRLVHQFASLERAVSKTGKELIAAPSGTPDDLANAACGALLLVDRDAPALVKQGGIANFVVKHPQFAHKTFSTMMLGKDGLVGEAYFSWTPPEYSHGLQQLTLLDVALGPLVVRPIRAVANRLLEARNSISRPSGIWIAVVPQPLHPQATAEGIGVDSYPKDMGTDYTSMAIEFATHLNSGRFRISEAAWSKSRDLPLASALSFRPGEKVDDNSLKLAIVVGVWMALSGAW